tara:strand:- start:91087 stop:91497 length:411 start_codon:yes stop_codon:yes gene_type:complete
MLRNIIILIIGLSFLFLFSSCSYFEKSNIESKPLIFEVTESKPLQFEIPHDSPNQWLKETAKKRRKLNRIRYEIAHELEQEELSDRQKSRNWYLKVDQKLYLGYDVVRYNNGEFDPPIKPKRQKPVSRFALLHGYY